MKIRTQTIVVLIFAMLYAFPASASPDFDFPMNGQSYGGKVRSGPGMNYRQIDSLGEGDYVVIVDDAGVMMNGYAWFRINYGNGRTGYQWGGLLCSERAYNGIYRPCAGTVAVAVAVPPSQNNANNNGDNRVVTGYNVQEVEYNGGDFVSNGSGIWTEIGSNGARFTFNEQFRDETSVFLNDPSRNVLLQLDVARMEILYAEGSDPLRLLYPIVRAFPGN